ncbi:MAG: hypothetical protein ACD_69C00062G0002 [uncultured bacterium]|nr:MAG: hypothetical protein ACD_69C00062G0002 [uncultured bacterium]OGT07960.1 MAG: hypothetical protein A2V89_00485 [Gammaproteobacteria bacterium RBG_16_37_9]HBC71964.1 hypothetical protein [Coxiellaceae bacterium]
MRILFFIFVLLTSINVFAVCPLCTFAVGLGIGLTQYCGIDDTISGLWIGGFTISLIVLTKNWFERKNISFYGYKIIIALAYYGSIILPLYFTGIIGHDLNKFWGMDKVVLGIVIGSIVFLAGSMVYEKMKKNNNGKAYFPFQKVVMPLAPLVILSILFYYLTK